MGLDEGLAVGEAERLSVGLLLGDTVGASVGLKEKERGREEKGREERGQEE